MWYREINDGKDVEPAEMNASLALEFENRWHVRTKVKEGVEISTVFLGLDHAFGDSVPVLYESMIFGGKYDQQCQRYHTRAEAEMGHNVFCAKAFDEYDDA